MKTEFFQIRDLHDPASCAILKRAGEILREGGLVVFPTETVYGLGANATDADAAKRIYAAKGRPSDNPLIIHVAYPEDAGKYAHTGPMYERLAKAFMPGPLTVILPKRDVVPTSVTGGLETVAVRCPSHPVAHRLIELAQIPIAAPSANLSGKPSPTSATHVAQDMDGRVDMIIDGGESEIGLESTIVKIDGDGLILLRPGGITYDALTLVCEKVTIADAVMHKLAENERPLSPGMKYRHYAPTAPLVLLTGEEDDVLAYCKHEAKAHKCAFLCYDEECEALAGNTLFAIGKKDDLGAQARRLFAALREADGTDAEIIYAHLPPMEGLGLALYNRLIRAAAHTIKEV